MYTDGRTDERNGQPYMRSLRAQRSKNALQYGRDREGGDSRKLYIQDFHNAIGRLITLWAMRWMKYEESTEM
jgi:hypothetical protein